MKKRFAGLLFIMTIIIYSITIVLFAKESITAARMDSDVMMDGILQKFEAYSINGNNYFKLRDIAYILNDSNKKFEVSWSMTKQAIFIDTGSPYTPIGREMEIDSNKAVKEATLTKSDIYVDGQKISLSAYNIDGYNYFKLRELGKALDFNVIWDNSSKIIQIESTSGYSEGILSPWDYAKILGKGIDVDWSKTEQGKKYYNEKTVKDFKAAGVSHVRIRIADKATEGLLQGLDQQINDCLTNGVKPIIAYQADELKNDPSEKNVEEAVEWWATVAERYKDYSHLLAFDLLIEATDAINKQPEKLNEIYEKIVTEIRKTNKTRIIMISPRLRSDADYLKELKIPSQHNEYLMAEWHFYASGPSKTNERKLWTTGTEKEKKLITDKINAALAWQMETGIPTWVGAWMPGNYNDGNDYSINEQVEFAKYMTEQLDKAQIPFAVNSDTKYYDREANKWLENMQPVFNTIFKAPSASTGSD